MKINNTELTELEKNKIEKMICPKCNDGLRKETAGDDTRLVCINYYCRWEISIDEASD
jgi:ssDNA-binding Zn-finger/Zn-ribbon topoisomerase 1